MVRAGALAWNHIGLLHNPHQPDGHVHLIPLGRFPAAQVLWGTELPTGTPPREGSSLCPGTVLAGVGIMGPEEGICTTSPQCQTPSRHTPPAPRLIPNCQSVFNFPQKIRLYMRLHKSLRSQTAASKGLAGWKLGCPAG